MRVLEYTGLQNMMVIVMAVAYFAMVVLDHRSKMSGPALWGVAEEPSPLPA